MLKFKDQILKLAKSKIKKMNKVSSFIRALQFIHTYPNSGFRISVF